MTDADDLEFVLIVGNDGDAANGYRALQSDRLACAARAAETPEAPLARSQNALSGCDLVDALIGGERSSRFP
jgi:hypothetical protein